MIILFILTCVSSLLLVLFILICWFSLLYIILIIFKHVILIAYSSRLSHFLLSLCVDVDDISVLCMTVCCMTSLILHDACIACLCWTHIYPLTSNFLVLVDFVSFDLVFHETCCFVYFLTKLVIQSRVSWWVILMLGRILEGGDTLMLIGVRYLKICIAQS